MISKSHNSHGLKCYLNMFGFILSALLGTAYAANSHGCGHGQLGPCTTISSNQVDNDLHFNSDLCLELLMIDCTKHVTTGDEVVCASNGVTYDNYCRFAHSRCEHYLIEGRHAIQLSVVHTGACTVTKAPPVPTTANPGGPTTAMSVGMTIVTNGPSTTTTTEAMTTTDIPTTTLAVFTQTLFCRLISTVSCDGFNIICGTDGQFYPNSCELAKAKCRYPTLTEDKNCTLPKLPGMIG